MDRLSKVCSLAVRYQHSPVITMYFLRHLVIVNENNKAVGIVTRKDLAKFRKWRKQGSSGVQQLGIVSEDGNLDDEAECCHGHS